MSAEILRTGPLSRVLRAANPGPMTLDGTNSYVLGNEAGLVVVDPGPLLEDHLVALAAAGTVKLILITHRHADHTEGSARLHELTGAPVRAALPKFCHDAPPLNDGESLQIAGLAMKVLATPGHTSDSLCFFLPDDGPHGSMLTGDTVLGQGTTVLDHPDGRLADYLSSLERLRDFGPATVLPGHGPVLPDLNAAVEMYLNHRAERLDQVRAAVEHLHATGHAVPTAEAVTELVYGDVPTAVQPAAVLAVRAQLHYLGDSTQGG